MCCIALRPNVACYELDDLGLCNELGGFLGSLLTFRLCISLDVASFELLVIEEFSGIQDVPKS